MFTIEDILIEIMFIFQYPSVKIDFVHGGGHMGAIGALLHGIKILDEHSK